MKYYDLIKVKKNKDREFITNADLVNEFCSRPFPDWTYVSIRLSFTMRIINASLLPSFGGLDCTILRKGVISHVLLKQNSYKQADGKINSFASYRETLTNFLEYIKNEHEYIVKDVFSFQEDILDQIQSFMTKNPQYKFEDKEVELTAKIYEYLWKKGYPVYREVEIDASQPILKNMWTEDWRPDLLFVLGDRYIPIEFKYQKVGAIDHSIAYDFWKDVYKLSHLKQCSDFLCGLVMFIAPSSFFVNSLESYKNNGKIENAGEGRPDFEIKERIMWKTKSIDISLDAQKIAMQIRSALVSK